MGKQSLLTPSHSIMSCSNQDLLVLHTVYSHYGANPHRLPKWFPWSHCQKTFKDATQTVSITQMCTPWTFMYTELHTLVGTYIYTCFHNYKREITSSKIKRETEGKRDIFQLTCESYNIDKYSQSELFTSISRKALRKKIVCIFCYIF